MTTELVVVGAGGFGREVLALIDDINRTDDDRYLRVTGVVDDSPSTANLARLASAGVAYLGDVSSLARVRPCGYVVGIGNPSVRKDIADRMDAMRFHAVSMIHPAASVGTSVRIGLGTVICAGARLTTNIDVGDHVHVNPNATVGHDSTIGSFVSMNPASSLSGDCVVEDGALIGVAAAILQQITIGRGSVVGASACVVRDVPPYVTVKGVPAR